MNVLEYFTCFVLAVVSAAVFRREFLKVRDVLVGFWMPKKRGKAKDNKRTRQESNKENFAPCETTVKTVQAETPAATKEMVSISDSTTKIIEETEGLRIKSVTLRDDTSSNIDSKLDSFTSEILKTETQAETNDVPTAEPFPAFSDLLQTQSLPKLPSLSNSSTKTEEISGDDRNYEKTVKETVHEVTGNTETTIVKEEHESIARGGGDLKMPSLESSVPGITLDTIDLNNLISATQKKLDSFKDSFKTDVSSSKMYEVKKTEMKTTSTSESKFCNMNSQMTSLGELKDITFPTTAADLKKDLNQTLGNLGLVSSDTESSYVTTDGPFGTTVISKKKKMFSSSSFYEEPHAIYPTVEEQVEMAKKIADSLADDTNKKSKGANMFFKRVKRSTKWIHEGPEPSDESGADTPELQGGEPPTPDPSLVPWKSHQKGPSNLRLVLDPRHTENASSLRSSGMLISEHNVVSPEVCHGLVKDLQSPRGKGAALFAKRKKKSEEWVVDEARVRAMMREREIKPLNMPTVPPLYQQYGIGRQEIKLVKTPWEAAMESPYGRCDSAFGRVNPDELADTVIKAADYKRTNSTLNSWEPRMESCISPPVPATPSGAYHDIYHAKAPKGWVTPINVCPVMPSLVPSAPVTHHASRDTSTAQNGYHPIKKMVFQNFNTVPRIWKGSST